MRFYITIGACNLSVWLVVFHSFHIVRYIFWGQVEVLSMVTGKPKTLAKLSGSKSDKTYICPKMQAVPIMPKSLVVSTKRSRDGMWRWVENITSHHCNDRHRVQGHHAMLPALDTSSSKDLVEMALPWYHGPSFMGGIIIAIIMGIIGGVLGQYLRYCKISSTNLESSFSNLPKFQSVLSVPRYDIPGYCGLRYNILGYWVPIYIF